MGKAETYTCVLPAHGTGGAFETQRRLHLARSGSACNGTESVSIRVDVAIVGAGVAGLWLANLLTGRGLAVVVCEARRLGGVQTSACQGIIHSGVKYSLGGAPTSAANGMAAMPKRWRECLRGSADVDLRGVPVLAENVHLYAARGSAKARALFASRMLADRCRRLDASATPPFEHGLLLALDDFAIDMPALIRRLAAPVRHRVVEQAVLPEMLVSNSHGIERIAGEQDIHANLFVFAAGVGNGELAAPGGFADVAFKRRGLVQVSASLCQPTPQLFVHCLSRTFGTAPDLTVTSHGRCLYVGGKVASDGVQRSPKAQIEAVGKALARELPFLDLTQASFQTHAVERMEPVGMGFRDTGDAFAMRRGNCVLCWAGKLTLAPRLGDAVLSLTADLLPRKNAWPGAETRLDYASPPYAESCASC